MKLRLVLPLLVAAATLAAQTHIDLAVDATDAPRHLLHARMTVTASPGVFKLVYPKWIPGEHGPTGPIADLVDLQLSAAGKPLTWRRDPVDMYAISTDVPVGATAVEALFDFITAPDTTGFSAGASATPELAMVSWNQVVLYPEGVPAAKVEVKAALKLPMSWRYATALPVAKEGGGWIEFQPASLERLVDSPVLAGRHFRSIELAPGTTPPHFLDLAADSEDALQVPDETIRAYTRLVEETGALFGARHYRDYHFLVSLSDHVAHFGLEHHESSDDRLPEIAMTDANSRRVHAGLLPHEMVHSWNGKYRRPAGLATPDFQQPMRDGMLWVYEGLTTYLGNVLTTRSGLETPEDYREYLASIAAALDNEPGRLWRPLLDTAVSAPFLYDARDDWENLRRGVDFYNEGDLIWLEADVIIRRESQGKRSLDDFCRRFFDGVSGPPELKPYTLDELIAEMNAVQPYNWREFFDQRINRIDPRAPLGGITGAGWKLVYTDQPSDWFETAEEEHKTVDVRYSLGLLVKEDGTIVDVLKGSPADRAGLTPATRLVAVAGRQFSRRAVRAAIRAAKGRVDSIELIVQDGERYIVYHAVCRTGERYPTLERDPSQPDLLSEIIKSKTATESARLLERLDAHNVAVRGVDAHAQQVAVAGR